MIEQEYQCLLTGESAVAVLDNHIQVAQAARKMFRGVQAELVFTAVNVHICSNDEFQGVLVIKESPFTLWKLYQMDVHSWLGHILDYDEAFLRFEYAFELRTDDPRIQGLVNGVYPGKTLSKGTLCRRIKRLIGPGLVIRHEIPCGRRSTIRNWKQDMLRDAEACRERIMANVEKSDHCI